MTDEEKKALSDAQNMVAGDLVRAAGRWALTTSMRWRADEPGNYLSFKRMFDTGKAGIRISITMGVGDQHHLDIVGVVDGKEYPIAWQNVTPTESDQVKH